MVLWPLSQLLRVEWNATHVLPEPEDSMLYSVPIQRVTAYSDLFKGVITLFLTSLES
jgi:hypothetical protein